MTIIDLHKLYYLETVDERWIPNISPLQDILNESGYNDNYKMIDNYFTRQYASLVVNSSMFDFTLDNVRSQIQSHIMEVLYSNIESIKRQFEIVKATYNPIENYDRYEEMDKETITRTNSPRTHTETLDKITNNTLTKVSGFNENTLVNDSGIEVSSSGTATGGKIENVTNDVQTIDTEVKTGSGVNGITNNHIHGNIGVTQASEMMANHYDFWEWFNFYEYIFNLAFEYISIGLYDTEDIDFSSGSTPTPTPTPTPSDVEWDSILNKPELLEPSDVVDNLESESIDKPLSAKQGYVLNENYLSTSELVNQVSQSLEATQEVVDGFSIQISSLATQVSVVANLMQVYTIPTNGNIDVNIPNNYRGLLIILGHVNNSKGILNVTSNSTGATTLGVWHSSPLAPVYNYTNRLNIGNSSGDALTVAFVNLQGVTS